MDPRNVAEAALYSPLRPERSEIRVLRLLAPSNGHFKDELCCTLEVFSLEEQPAYVFNALSYVWGDASNKKPIVINGRKVQITKNLESALRRIRSYTPDRSHGNLPATPLWVDALSINQADTAERQHQVEAMAKIYKQASKVLSWLGEPDRWTRWVFEKLNNTVWCDAYQTHHSSGGKGTVEQQRFNVLFTFHIYALPYWTRVWILQETALATGEPLLLCGQDIVAFGHFNKFRELVGSAEHLNDRKVLTDLPIHTIRRIIRLMIDPKEMMSGICGPAIHCHVRRAYRRKGGLSLRFLFNYLQGLRASDTRDYIYGVCSLLPEAQRRLIDINYTKAPVQVIYDAWAASIMIEPAEGQDSDQLRGNVVNAIENTGMSSYSREQDWPSWLPRFPSGSLTFTTSYLFLGDYGFNKWWRYPTFAHAVIEQDERILSIEGWEFDAVDAVYPVKFLPACDHKSTYLGFKMGTLLGSLTLKDLKRLDRVASAARGRPLTNARLREFECLRDAEPIWKTMTSWDEVVIHHSKEFSKDVDWCSSSDEIKGFLWESLMGRGSKVWVPDVLAAFDMDWTSEGVGKKRNALISLIADGLGLSDAATMMDNDTAEIALLRPWIEAIRFRLNNHQAFTTESGFFGVGTLQIAKGDIVVLLEGMQLLFVLRPYEPPAQSTATASGSAAQPIKNTSFEKRFDIDQHVQAKPVHMRTKSLEGYKLSGLARVGGLMEWDKLNESMTKGSLEKKTFKIY
jgi:hypothetical protein